MGLAASPTTRSVGSTSCFLGSMLRLTEWARFRMLIYHLEMGEIMRTTILRVVPTLGLLLATAGPIAAELGTGPSPGINAPAYCAKNATCAYPQPRAPRGARTPSKCADQSDRSWRACTATGTCYMTVYPCSGRTIGPGSRMPKT